MRHSAVAFFIVALVGTAALVGAAACSSGSNAGPACVDTATTGQSRPLNTDLACSGMETCKIYCECQDGSFANSEHACKDGVCAGSWEPCSIYCANKGGVRVFSGGGTDNPPGSSSGNEEKPPSGATSSSGTTASSSGGAPSSAPPCPPASTSSASSSGGSTSSSSGSASSSSGTVGTSTSSSGGNDTPIRCESSPTLCLCGRGDLFRNGSESTACSLSTIGGSGRCCASSEWPASGGCQCDARPGNCHKSVDKKTCLCGIAAPGPGEESVGSCSGSICCLEPSNGAPTCTCYTNVSSCLLGGTQVSSCSVADLKCEGKSVSSCR